MDIPELSGHRMQIALKARPARQTAFSLIEVTLALGIIAFAFVAVFGLIPTGMTVFRQAMDASVGSQIAQQVTNDAQQADFKELLKDSSGTTITGASGRKAVRYFDDQGNELPSAQASAAIYHVNTRVVPATGLPAGGTPAAGDANIATVTIQVANNPGNQQLTVSAANLWTGAYVSGNTGTAPIATYTAMVARSNQ